MKATNLALTLAALLTTGTVMAQENKKMKELRTEIIIDASPQDVWDVLSDFASYPKWNPFIVSISGEPLNNEKLNATLTMNDKKTMVIKPVVQESIPGEKFEWLGTSFLGIFNGRHYFEIERVNDSQVKFIHGEKFTGWLVKPIMKKIGEDTENNFIAMNGALKARAEQLSASRENR